ARPEAAGRIRRHEVLVDACVAVVVAPVAIVDRAEVGERIARVERARAIRPARGAAAQGRGLLGAEADPVLLLTERPDEPGVGGVGQAIAGVVEAVADLAGRARGLGRAGVAD